MRPCCGTKSVSRQRLIASPRRGFTMNVGFVGLGTMGTPIVLNLLKHGFRVKVYTTHLDSENVKLVVGKGAVAVRSAREASQGSRVVMMSLPSAEVSEKVALGRGGILEGAAPGTIIVEMSTVPPSTVRRIEEVARRRGVHILDAPVSGGRVGAEHGTLTVMVGGDKDAFERCRDVFEAIGKNIYHVGELGAGESIKLINSLLADANLLIAREGLELASKSNIDPKLLQKIVGVSTGQSWMWNNWVPSILDGKAVGATFATALKDFDYALAIAEEVGADPKIAKEAHSTLTGWRKRRGGSTDVSSAFDFS